MNKDELKQIILECNECFMKTLKAFDKMINENKDIGDEVKQKLEECFTYAKSVINHTAFKHGEIMGKELVPEEPKEATNESPLQAQ